MILALSHNAVRYHGALEPMAASCLALARAADVPIGLHLDHVEDLSLVEAAADLGFGSVMFDASTLPYEDNVEATREAARLLHGSDRWLESELGEIGGKDGAHAPHVRTDPERPPPSSPTRASTLAVAVGSSHAMTSTRRSSTSTSCAGCATPCRFRWSCTARRECPTPASPRPCAPVWSRSTSVRSSTSPSPTPSAPALPTRADRTPALTSRPAARRWRMSYSAWSESSRDRAGHTETTTGRRGRANLLRSCHDRRLDREGIPMVLVLEDERPAAARSDDRGRSGGRLRRPARGIRRSADPGRRFGPTTRALITVLQVLAYAHFASPDLTSAPARAPPPPGAFRRGQLIRVVNYHSTPLEYPVLERELSDLAGAFAPVTLDDLDSLFETGEWHKDKPGVLPVFYEGYRNSATVAAPLCEKVGLTGWFPVATQFLSTAVEHQEAFARAHWIYLVEEDLRGDRIAMSGRSSRTSPGVTFFPHTATHEGFDTVLAERSSRAR